MYQIIKPSIVTSSPHQIVKLPSSSNFQHPTSITLIKHPVKFPYFCTLKPPMKIGDKISVIDDALKGTITSLKGAVIVFRDEHGFTHQERKEKLVLQNPEIYENVPTVIKKETAKPLSKKHNRKHLVLDLHFENLVKNPADYDAFERIFIQKEKLEETIAFCRNNNLKKLEIIHGIGDGVLQRMVHDYLVGQTNLEFDDDDFFYHQRGSVMVTLR